MSAGKKRRGIKKVLHCTKLFFLVLFLLALVAAVVLGYLAYQKYYPLYEEYRDYATKVVDNSTDQDFRTEQTSYIYDSDGNQLCKLKTDKDVNYVKYSDLPEQLVNATVAIEDKRFWDHEGVDWMSTAKATYLYVKNPNVITRGGSTITQQLVKNVYLSYETSIERKAKEILIALRLEKKFGKQQIFEFYVNNINYANGYYGIGAAAKGYFNKKVKDLSLEEIAFLCAIPNNPSYYDPMTNIEHTTSRRNLILSEMFSQGYISQEEYLKASNSPIHFHKVKQRDYNYEVSYAIDCTVRALMEKSGFGFQYSYRSMKAYEKYREQYLEAYNEAKQRLYTGGYRVYTSIDPKAQKRLQRVLNKTLSGFKEKTKDGVYKMQGAATVIDNKSQKVIAIVGGRHQDFNGVITLNRAYQTFKQPGSTIKPLVVYTPALENGYGTETLVDDSPIVNGPSNSDRSYLGWIPLRKAVEKSKNVVAWRIFGKLGASKCLRYLQRMHFSKIVPSDYYQSSALGGLTYGVSTVEMASGYATLANDGVFREPTCVTQIKTSNGVKLDVPAEESVRVYSESAARDMTDVLQGVAKNGTAHNLDLGSKMPVACKTGTTNNQTNGWFCGYTPYYSVACYVGYDENKGLSSLWGATYPMKVWEGIQKYLNSGKKIVKFKKKVVEKPKVEKKTETVSSVRNTDTPEWTEVPEKTEEVSIATQKPVVTQKPKKKKVVIEEVTETDPPDDVQTEPETEQNNDDDTDSADESIDVSEDDIE